MSNHRVIHGDCADVLPCLGVEADLILTSPPYDDLRTYGGHGFDFDSVADACVGALKPGGVIVWVVADATVDGSETGTSFRHALGFMERGLRLHDHHDLREERHVLAAAREYHQCFEYMFVFTNGVWATFNPINDRPNRFRERWSSKAGERGKDGKIKPRTRPTKFPEFGSRFNIWYYETGGQSRTSDFDEGDDHPARFPDDLARDHIITWTNPGDLVIDPMAGSGTTLRAAKDLGRNSIGVEIHEPYVDIINRRMPQAVLAL